jgi:hypothetical protein
VAFLLRDLKIRMAKRPPYLEVINMNLSTDPDWGPYARGEASLPSSRLRGAYTWAGWLFYLGDLERAKEVSYAYSVWAQPKDPRPFFPRNHPLGLHAGLFLNLFRTALFRDLAQAHLEAQALWQRLVDERRRVSEDDILKHRAVRIWVYEAYALAKLGRYDEVALPARKGFEGICNGKGVDRAPHNNSREYGLVAVLEGLAAYQMKPTPEGKEKAQKALTVYKRENLRYGRLGYEVIFDLQFSYPDVFTPVLPGPNPEKD